MSEKERRALQKYAFWQGLLNVKSDKDQQFSEIRIDYNSVGCESCKGCGQGEGCHM